MPPPHTLLKPWRVQEAALASTLSRASRPVVPVGAANVVLAAAARMVMRVVNCMVGSAVVIVEVMDRYEELQRWRLR